jgi:hypothetical protein
MFDEALDSNPTVPLLPSTTVHFPSRVPLLKSSSGVSEDVFPFSKLT